MLAEREAGRNSGRRQRLRTRGEEWVLLISLQTGLELGPIISAFIFREGKKKTPNLKK